MIVGTHFTNKFLSSVIYQPLHSKVLNMFFTKFKETVPTRPTEVLQNEKFSECSSGITVKENGQVAVHGPSANQQYALGENVYQRGIVRFKLKLESFHSNDWIFVRIVKADVKPDGND